jgi:hypothetical protein
MYISSLIQHHGIYGQMLRVIHSHLQETYSARWRVARESSLFERAPTLPDLRIVSRNDGDLLAQDKASSNDARFS